MLHERTGKPEWKKTKTIVFSLSVLICLLIFNTPFAYAVTAPTNDACDSSTPFTQGTNGWVNVTVSDVDLVANLDSVDIQVNTTGDAETFTLRWTQSTNTFSEVSDTSNICTESNSVRVNIDADTDQICFRFKLYGGTSGNCDVIVTSTDDAGGA